MQLVSRPFRYVPDEKLPEGRLTVPFSVDFALWKAANPNVPLPTIQNFPYDLTKCAVVLIDAHAIKSPAPISAFKSMQFCIEAREYATSAGGTSPMFIYVEDTQQLACIPLTVPQENFYIPPVGERDTNAWATGCIPIISSTATKLYLIKTPENIGAGETVDGFASFVFANFEMAPYLVSNGGLSILPS